MIHDPGSREGNKDYRSHQIWAGPQWWWGPLQTAVVPVYCSALDMPQYGPRRSHSRVSTTIIAYFRLQQSNVLIPKLAVA